MDEFDFQVDPSASAIDFMRTVLTEDPGSSLADRLAFMTALMGPGTGEKDLAEWMIHAL